MRKSEYKRVDGSASDIQARLRLRGIVCITRGWTRWAKRYLNRERRRKWKWKVEIWNE